MIVVIGRRHKPAAVLVSFTFYEQLTDLIDETRPASLIRERLSTSTTSPDLPLEEIAGPLGINAEEPSSSTLNGHGSAARQLDDRGTAGGY